jgi:hypothetical protein
MAFACVLRNARAEHDASHAHVDAVWRDCSIQLSIFSSQSEWRRDLGQMLDERVTVLGL